MRPRSQTVLAYREHPPADLESVLGATPQEFESLILRHAFLQETKCAGAVEAASTARFAAPGFTVTAAGLTGAGITVRLAGRR
jgi:hypothetical protein